MPRYAANLTMLYTEVPFLDRYALAAEDGFEAVEFLFPYAWPASEIRRRLDDYGLQLVLHNLPAGDWDAGERGIACHPDRVEEFRAGVGRAIEYAQALGVKQLNCLAGKAPAGVEDARLRATFIDNLRHAASALKQAGLDLLIEPINTLDIPGFYLNRTAQAAAILAETGADNAFLQYDIYHAQRMEGELAATLRQYFPLIRHVQLADNPPQRARHRRDQLSLSARPAGPARLRRLGRLRIQARHHHGRRPGLAASAGAVTPVRLRLHNNTRFPFRRRQAMTASPLKIGFVGLGIMGAPMAGHLARAGHPLYVHTLGKLPGEIAETTAVPCLNGRDVAERSDIVFIMVPDTPDVESALFAQHGIAAGLAEGKTVVDMSSISPIATKRFAEKIRALGCDYLDAPVSGGEVGARNATLSIMAGGDEAVFARVKPLFELMGKNITLVGGNGDGQTAKVANQIIVALNIQAVAEALLFAARAGADPARVRQALMGGFASSKILEVHGERMIKRSFDPGFRIELHQKDLNLALSSARALGVSLPNTATTQEMFNACAGGKAWDHSALVRALEQLANFEIGQQA